eukprot:4280764-Pyramimonas_sp.AAC.1
MCRRPPQDEPPARLRLCDGWHLPHRPVPAVCGQFRFECPGAEHADHLGRPRPCVLGRTGRRATFPPESDEGRGRGRRKAEEEEVSRRKSRRRRRELSTPALR